MLLPPETCRERTGWKSTASAGRSCARTGSDDPWYRAEAEAALLETDGENPQHAGVINAFAAHLLRGEPTVAEAEDGLRALELSNAIHLSGWTGERVEIPVSCEAFDRELDKRIAKSVPRTGGDITYDTDHSRGGSRNN